MIITMLYNYFGFLLCLIGGYFRKKIPGDLVSEKPEGFNENFLIMGDMNSSIDERDERETSSENNNESESLNDIF